MALVLILIAILISVNLITILLTFPETTFYRVLVTRETAAETDKKAQEMAEHIEQNDLKSVPTNAEPDGILRSHYAGIYLKDLVYFHGRSHEPSTPNSMAKAILLSIPLPSHSRRAFRILLLRRHPCWVE